MAGLTLEVEVDGQWSASRSRRTPGRPVRRMGFLAGRGRYGLAPSLPAGAIIDHAKQESKAFLNTAGQRRLLDQMQSGLC